MVANHEHPDSILDPLIETMDLILKKLADTQWLLLVLWILEPSNEIFRSDYYYQKPKRAAA